MTGDYLRTIVTLGKRSFNGQVQVKQVNEDSDTEPDEQLS